MWGKSKKRGHRSEETKQKIRDAHRKRREAKEKLEAKKCEKPRDIRADLADYLGLNPKKGSEASQEAPGSTKGENTKVCA